MGNGCSLCYTSWTQISCPSREQRIEEFIIVWLNTSPDKNSMKTEEIKRNLQKYVNLVITCDHPEQCLNFIDGIQDEKIFLVVSGLTIKQVISKALESPQIESIYCLCTQREAKKIGHINGIPDPFTSLESLYNCMANDTRRCKRNLIKPVIIETDEEKILIMYDRLLQEIILNSKENSLDDLVQFLRTSYNDNINERNFLDEFHSNYENFLPSHWYTRDNCLYKVLNRALRMHDYENLYLMHVFIRHLHQDILFQFKEKQCKIKTLFRGQALDISIFERINCNEKKTIFFPYFLSTSIKREVGEDFAGKSVNDLKKNVQVKVLFEINIDENVPFPYAEISDNSAYKEEEEWLFSMGSSFRIDSVECASADIKLIKLTLIDDNNNELNELMKHLKNFVKDDNICLNFGRVMYQMGYWKRSEEFYKRALEKEKGCFHREAAIYNNLGSITFENKQYDNALKYYQQSLELEQKEENIIDQNLVFIYQNIATVYYKKRQIDLAIKNLQIAIEIHNSSLSRDLNISSTLYNNMACILNYQNKHDQALINNEKCLRIRERTLPSIHPALATTYNNTAITYNHLYLSLNTTQNDTKVHNCAQKAVDIIGKAINIDNRSLLSDHPQIKIHKKNLEYLLNES